MNINKNINKLLFALQQKNKLYKINSFKFYSEQNNKYCTKYQILKLETVNEYDRILEQMADKEKYVPKKDCYSKIDLMKYFIEEYSKGSEASG